MQSFTLGQAPIIVKVGKKVASVKVHCGSHHREMAIVQALRRNSTYADMRALKFSHI
jgi:hypothetical protein